MLKRKIVFYAIKYHYAMIRLYRNIMGLKTIKPKSRIGTFLLGRFIYHCEKHFIMNKEMEHILG